jgi:hypothetical protein
VTSFADHVAPLYPQNPALTSPASSSHYVGIVLLRTKSQWSYIVASPLLSSCLLCTVPPPLQHVTCSCSPVSPDILNFILLQFCTCVCLDRRFTPPKRLLASLTFAFEWSALIEDCRPQSHSVHLGLPARSPDRLSHLADTFECSSVYNCLPRADWDIVECADYCQYERRYRRLSRHPCGSIVLRFLYAGRLCGSNTVIGNLASDRF